MREEEDVYCGEARVVEVGAATVMVCTMTVVWSAWVGVRRRASRESSGYRWCAIWGWVKASGPGRCFLLFQLMQCKDCTQSLVFSTNRVC